MRSSLFTIIALTLMLSVAFPVALTATSNGTCYTIQAAIEDSSIDLSENGSSNQSITVYFFYGNGCPHCALVEPLIESLAAKYPQVVLKELEVYHDSANRALFQDFNARYGVTNTMIPSVFIGDEALIGEDAIKNNLESSIQHLINNASDADSKNTSNTNDTNATNLNRARIPVMDCGIGSTGTNDTSNLTNPPASSPSPNQTNSPPSTDLTIAMVIVAAAADSINPCAISVMIFLLIFMTSLGNKRRVLQVGTVYVGTVYLVYFMAGLGILAFLQSTAITRIVYYAAAIMSIIIGLINIKDYLLNKKPTLAISESRKPMIKKYIEKASIPAAIVLGFAVSLFELPCTGGIYFAILTLLGDKMTVAEGIPYLALYNAIYVLPLAVILAIIYMGVSAEKANSWRLENRRSLRLVIGLVMLILGAVMILEVL